MSVSIHPDAEQDIAEAATFYQREGSPALGARFIREFRRIAELLSEFPEMGASRSRGHRGMTMGIFSYTLSYRCIPGEIRVLVVKHDSRKPGYGERRT